MSYTLSKFIKLTDPAALAEHFRSHGIKLPFADDSKASPSKCASAIEAFLKRSALPMNGLVLDNGSGLSRDEHISATSLADLLMAANASPVAQVFVESLPIAVRFLADEAGGMRMVVTGEAMLGGPVSGEYVRE